MLENIDLSRKLPKSEYKQLKETSERKLSVLQRKLIDLGIPVIVVFEGWDAAGKGTLINDLILPLDPRGFKVHTSLPPTEEEALHPFLWRFWLRTPACGRLAIFDRSWYDQVLKARADGDMKQATAARAYEDIESFERNLIDDGCVVIKLFLHISRKEQKKRFDKLKADSTTAWRVTEEDLCRHRRYKRYLKLTEQMLVASDSGDGPWTIVEATQRRFASAKVMTTVIETLERHTRREQRRRAAARRARATKAKAKQASPLAASVLESVDLSPSLGRSNYHTELKRHQSRLRELEHEIYRRRIPVVIVYEGWDAAGKGGNLRRLTQKLDPRGYEVIPIGAPNATEQAHHYLWRFWTQMPKAGHMAIFDRSWYGRVMVERVEGFCSEAEWKRAYHEINDMEQHMANFGSVIVKFWLHIDPEEQLRRFEARQKTPYKRWKITGEDWRNRDKWDLYRVAINEMLFRTSTPAAPWTIVESNCKWFARIKTMETVIAAIEARLA